MRSKKAREILRDIKELRIQGARNVAKAALEALKEEAKAGATYEELFKAGFELMNARETEPMARHLTEGLLLTVLKEVDRGSLAELVEEEVEAILKKVEEEFQALVEIGANFLPEGLIITYCHSSTVTAILKRAYALGKDIEVVAGETRPLFQGRITARELAEANVPVTLVVDGALSSIIPKADLVLVGADAVSAEGDLVNKVGTSAVAKAAHHHRVPFYSALERYKYDPLSRLGFPIAIEERPPEEVWEDRPEGVHIYNPAFDVTDRSLIKAFITSRGILPPSALPILEELREGPSP